MYFQISIALYMLYVFADTIALSMLFPDLYSPVHALRTAWIVCVRGAGHHDSPVPRHRVHLQQAAQVPDTADEAEGFPNQTH